MTTSIRALAAALLACAASSFAAPSLPVDQPKPYVHVQHPAWARSATLYQINTRQFTPEGTFKAAEAQLPRLQQLGVDILWLMPIHPIGEKHRKGSLGSPYAVKDYLAVNPEFGTLAEFKSFVATAHRLGLKVILDWVGNHTAWDNVLVTKHPDWYDRDEHGGFRPTPWYDWDDIIDLDYAKPQLRRYMTNAMLYWVRDVGVDGYRVDAAGLSPLDFWEQAAKELRAVKPVFLLAEWESRDMHARAFDASYSWTWWDAMKLIAEGRADATSLYPYYAWHRKFYPREAYRMLYTTNHDKNAWEGTEQEIFGAAAQATTVLSFISEGMPMIYNGQEAGLAKRLAFFERDPIAWKDGAPEGELLKRLIALKKQHKALWNGADGAVMEPIANSAPKQVFSFQRGNIVGVFNLSAKPVDVTLKGSRQVGRFTDFSNGAAVTMNDGSTLSLPAWGWRVLVK
ncbi:alpha-amylase family glycosyl hydrolase [Roseateles asaccharophilus]|uniref:Glycosidase n=1 Tax=Roseateles asaccharophilus TaxID=582607 RepID=A0ABU2A6U0_9BURK|nr:alpha-amylase family glycosyl hydrolase [Roseateles asaccharophilus]MDR7332918.1 glycosidase [Roseateles asaccharophilus]